MKDFVFDVFSALANDLRNYFVKQADDPADVQIKSPNIIVEPAEPVLNSAVQILKMMDPNYFSGVNKIVAKPSSAYGHVESGQDKDPTVININLGRIVQESNMGSKADAIIAAAVTIAHERGHVLSYNQSEGFVGGEGPAENEERKVVSWIENNKDRIQNILNT